MSKRYNQKKVKRGIDDNNTNFFDTLIHNMMSDVRFHTDNLYCSVFQQKEQNAIHKGYRVAMSHNTVPQFETMLKKYFFLKNHRHAMRIPIVEEELSYFYNSETQKLPQNVKQVKQKVFGESREFPIDVCSSSEEEDALESHHVNTQRYPVRQHRRSQMVLQHGQKQQDNSGNSSDNSDVEEVCAPAVTIVHIDVDSDDTCEN